MFTSHRFSITTPIRHTHREQVEEALYEIESLRRFCGICLEAVLDESTILQFRHRPRLEIRTKRTIPRCMPARKAFNG
nr:transposase [Methylomonas sp. ZR1]